MDSKLFEGLRSFAVAVSLAIVLSSASPLAASPSSSWGRLREIKVHTVAELYAAVNRPACPISAACNVRIRLAPGTYVLSELGGWGAPPRPHRGALRLLPGMSLVGSEQHVDTNGDGVPDPVDPENPDDFAVPGTETLIDGSQLFLEPEERADCTGDARAIFPDPIIFVGRNNTISGLSVFAGGNIAIGEPTNDRIDPTGSLSIEVTDSVITSDFVAMSFANSECAARRARSVLTFSHNVLRGAGFFGLGIANFYTGDSSNDPSDGPQIQAMVSFNLFYNNGTALRAVAGDEGTDGGVLKLHMTGNIFRNNATNFMGRGAVGRLELPTVGNRLFVRSDFDTFGEAAESVILTAGVLLELGEPRECELEAQFFDSRFIRDSPETAPEISITGNGSDNHAVVEISRATVKTSEGVPVEGALLIEDGTGETAPSTARLEGSQEEFIQENQGFPAPPVEFFLEP